MKGKYLIIFLSLLLLAGCAGQKAAKIETVEPTEKAMTADFGKEVLGTERIYISERLGNKYDEIIIEDFSLDETDIQQVDETKHPGFKTTVKSLATKVPDTVSVSLMEWHVFKKVTRVAKIENPPSSAVIMKVRFTQITSGSRALRFWVGFGAGTSTVGVDGELIDASTGKSLARFFHNRHSPASMGDYNTVLNADGTNLGKDIAKFLKKLY